LHEPCAASVSVFAERNGTTREDKSMTQVVDNLFAGALNIAPDLLTTEEVAKIFRVTPSTVLRWVAHEELKCVQVGPKMHRFPKWCIEEYLSTAAKSNVDQ
jgi:excisionase family DNA binding protein